MEKLKTKYHEKIKALNEILWDGKATYKNVNAWLENFAEQERVSLLYLLTQFIYFNDEQIKSLLESLYRDLFKYKIIEKIRRDNDNTLDINFIEEKFNEILLKTRFITIGGINSSSGMLFYDFGKINEIGDLDIFVSQKNILNESEDVEYFIFLDDICSSGSQVESKLKNTIQDIRDKFSNAKIFYYTLISTHEGNERVTKLNFFDDLDHVLFLNKSFRCFEENSRILKNIDTEIKVNDLKIACENYGKKIYTYYYLYQGMEYEDAINLADRDKLGYKNGQLLLGFRHNTPDNTLPIFWMNQDNINWVPIFKRTK